MIHSFVPREGWRKRLYTIIFEADTPAGKRFDVALLWLIVISVLLVMLESVREINQRYFYLLNAAEWTITLIFTLEYVARIICIKHPWRYIFSFYGLIDLLSTIPKYLSLLYFGTQVLVAFRALRLLRLFRILNLHQYVGESQKLTSALRASRTRISVFLFAILIICVVLGTVMYLVEGREGGGFTSIPKSIYWAIVTLTTVGYGDIAPETTLGQIIASFIMILGYAIIAIPTGIVSNELAKGDGVGSDKPPKISCPHCQAQGHQAHADYCFKCGKPLDRQRIDNRPIE